MLRQRASPSVAINRNTHRIPVPPVGYRPDRPYPLCRHTPIRWTLPSAVVRTVAPSAGYTPWSWAGSGSGCDPAISASPPAAAMPVITAASTGRDDAGLFEANLRDERWLPFEGQGAVSTWSLTLDQRDNSFDLSSITDVVLHVRYTARYGGDAETVRTALKPDKARSVLVSSRAVFGTRLLSLLPAGRQHRDSEALVLPLTDAIFPFLRSGNAADHQRVGDHGADRAPKPGPRHGARQRPRDRRHLRPLGRQRGADGDQAHTHRRDGRGRRAGRGAVQRRDRPGDAGGSASFTTAIPQSAVRCRSRRSSTAERGSTRIRSTTSCC